MELSHAQLLGFRTKFETLFNGAFELAETQIEKIALKVDSGRVELVNHRWMKGLAGMREFKDARVHNNISTDGFVVKNKLWEDTLSLDRVDIERDQFGIYAPMIARMGEVAKQHRDSLGFGLLSDMLTTSTITAYDSIAFYGNHNTGRTVAFNNKTTAHLAEGSLSTGITELKKRKDSAGNPLSAASKKPLLVIPPALSLVARKLANQSFFPTTQPNSGASSSTNQAAAGENILQGMFDIVESPFLKTDTEWHLTLVDSLYKPIVWQVEQDIEFLGYDKFINEWSNNDKFVNGVRALYNVAPGLPEMCYGSTGAA